MNSRMTDEPFTHGSTDAPPKTILCIENDRDAEGLQAALVGYDTIFAPTAFDALRHLNHGFHDAYIVNDWMSDWDGVSLCREIRKMDPKGPILFLTKRDALCQRALKAGANSCTGKPIDALKVRTELRVLLGLAHAESDRAKMAAMRAVQHELERCTVEALKGSVGKQQIAQTIARTTRTTAFDAFAQSGGTRANFERWWPVFFQGAWARYQGQSWHGELPGTI